MSKKYSDKDDKLLYPEKTYLREDDELIHLREDELTADIVERGIALRNMYGSAYAIRYLKERDIGQDVINRVLSSGNRRKGM